MNVLAPTFWAPLLTAAIVGTAWYFVVVRTDRRGKQLQAQNDARGVDDLDPTRNPGILALELADQEPFVFAATPAIPANSTPFNLVALIQQPRIRPFLLLLVAALIWMIGGRSGPALAFVALWYGARALLQARTRHRIAMEQERCALHAINTAGRALGAGIPITGVLQILAAEGEGDAGRAFQEIVQRENLGEELPSIIRRVLLNSPLPALRAFGLALLVQFDAGGNIAGTTDRLARSLIERSRVRRRTQTIVAYGRTTANLIALGPVFALPLMSMSIDGYSDFILNRPSGNILLAVSTMMLVVGLVSVHRMSRIEVIRPASTT